MPLPMLQTTDAEGNTDPVEALPVSRSEGYGSFAYAGLERSLGVSLETQAIGKLGGGKFVSYDDAKRRLDDEGYDYHVLHGNGLFDGELNAIINQQSAIKRNEAIGQQSGASPYWEMLGGAADPLFLAAGPVARGLGFVARGVGLGRFMSSAAAVSAKGGVLGAAGGGAAIGAGYDFAQSKVGTAEGDADVGTHRMVVDAAIGGVTFGLLHGLTAPKVQNLQTLAVNKASLREALPGVQITSDFRTPEHNAKVHGVPDSMHLTGEAIDFVLPKGMTAEQARAEIVKRGLPITEWIVEKRGDPHSTGDHVHWGWRGAKAPAETLGAVAPDGLQNAYKSAISAAETDSHVHIDADVSHETFGPDSFTENDSESRFHRAVVYHATNKDFVDYDLSHAGEGGGGKDAKEATFFIDKPHLAAGYANFTARMDPRNVARDEVFGQNVRPVITHLENPKEVDFGGQMYSQTRFLNEIRAAKRAGHDAVIFRNVNDSVSGHAEPGDVYAVFDANKSTRPFFGQKVNLKPGKVEPGSLFTRDVKPPDPGAPPPPEDAAGVQREADAFAAEAQAMHEMSGGEAGSLPPEFDAIEETLRNEGYSPDMVKAVQAAIRCGLTKGM